MINKFSILCFFSLLWLASFSYAGNDHSRGVPIVLIDEKLYYKDWPVRRNTEALLELDIFRKVFSIFDEELHHVIVIRYPGGDRGNTWAIEFKEWLVSLGIPSRYIFLEPASGGVDYLVIILESSNFRTGDQQ